MSKDELEAILARAAAATKGPWRVTVDEGKEVERPPINLEGRPETFQPALPFDGQAPNLICYMGNTEEESAVHIAAPDDAALVEGTGDQDFIAHARMDVPSLGLALMQAQEELRLEKLDRENAEDVLSNVEPELREKKKALQAIWSLVEDGQDEVSAKVRALVPRFGIARKVP